MIYLEGGKAFSCFRCSHSHAKQSWKRWEGPLYFYLFCPGIDHTVSNWYLSVINRFCNRVLKKNVRLTRLRDVIKKATSHKFINLATKSIAWDTRQQNRCAENKFGHPAHQIPPISPKKEGGQIANPPTKMADMTRSIIRQCRNILYCHTKQHQTIAITIIKHSPKIPRPITIIHVYYWFKRKTIEFELKESKCNAFNK